MAVDYKNKYIDLRSKFTKSCEMYYRTGYEEGLKEGQIQAQQQQMEMQRQQEMMNQGIDPETGMPIEGGPQVDENGQPIEGMSPEEGMSSEGGMVPSEMGEGEASELDQKIAELESLVQKGEKPKVTELRKSVNEIVEIMKTHKNRLASNHKVVTTSKQKQLVNNMLKKWEDEANNKSVIEDLEDIISKEGLKLE